MLLPASSMTELVVLSFYQDRPLRDLCPQASMLPVKA